MFRRSRLLTRRSLAALAAAGVTFCIVFPAAAESVSLPASVPVPASAPAAVPSPDASDDDALRPPSAVVREVETCAADAGGWFVRERELWLRFLAEACGVLAVGGIGLWLWSRFTRRGRRGVLIGWKREAARSIVPPVTVFLMVTACFFLFQPLADTLPHRFRDLDMRIFYSAAALITAWGVLSVVSVLDARLRRFARRTDSALDDLTVGVVGTGLRIAVAVGCFFFIGQSVFDFNITALLAGAGVIGLAVALAAKDTLSNVFGTMVILADAPFRPGDRIRAGDVDGIVLRVGMRSTRILTDDESVCTVPNSVFTNTVVRRSSRRGFLKHTLELSLVYDTSPEELVRAEKILHEILDDFHGPDEAKYAPHVFFSGFGDSALKLRAIVWLKTESFAEEEHLLDELHLAILRRFDEAGLNFAFPTVTVTTPSARPTEPLPPR